MIHCSKQSRGFTLIEALVAVAILAIAVAGPMYTASRTIVAAQISKSQLIASYLAQEGLEYVHMMRDNDFLYYYSQGGTDVSSTAWSNFTTDAASGRSIARCTAPAVCTVDPWGSEGSGPIGSGAVVTPCSSNDWATCAPLQLKTINGTTVYTTQVGGDATKTLFTRTVQVSPITLNGGNNELKVTSTVHWTSHNVPYTVTAIDHLTAWQ